MDKELVVAVDVMLNLQEWLESFNGLSHIPTANVNYSKFVTQILIDDLCVWDNQSNIIEELTLDSCKAEWQRHCANLSVYT